MWPTLYKVNPISHWTNFSETPTYVQYDGDSYVMYNVSEDCLLGIADLSKNNLRRKCNSRHLRKGALDRWKPTLIGDPWAIFTKTQAVESLDEVVVYCLGSNMTINGEEKPCPPFPFSLDSSISWNTSDYSYQGIAKEVYNFTLGPWTQYLDLREVHITEEAEDDTKNIRKLMDLNQKIIALEREQIAISNPVGAGGVSYPLATKVCL